MKKLAVLFACSCLSLFSACGEIPNQFQGAFESKDNNLKITVTRQNATLSANGTEYGFYKSFIGFSEIYKNLNLGTSGIYMMPVRTGINPIIEPNFPHISGRKYEKNFSDHLWDIYFIIADRQPAERFNGLTSYSVDIYYTRIDTSEKTPIKTINITYVNSADISTGPLWRRNSWSIEWPYSETKVITAERVQ